MPVSKGTEAEKTQENFTLKLKYSFYSMLFDDQYVIFSFESGGNGLVDKILTKGELIIPSGRYIMVKIISVHKYDDAKI